ncbi:cytochrome C biogenesis protein [Devosia epidermidihirudinis]|uniref:Cytochrome C biogenesis protein n=1 Tax=Devosia epidermidihirudinis TaxID=1293439 RepID=A0A0F5QG35_9HYPH|nr:cytochrome c biogenesis protein DipZ [Devosia epidermidihirudinis]KKC39658.1 cytochrome C biogenesis protein [Devosia epidermidihirudinis]
MLIFLLAYLGGALTIVSPCILPVLPFVFARSDKPFLQSGLPLLIGMAVTFAAVATLAAFAGGWAVAANQYGRITAMVLLAAFGVSLLIPQLADRLMQPLVNLGARLSVSAQAKQTGTTGAVLASLLLGVATGLLWAPCAGPILGLILTGAALSGANVTTTLLLLAYAAGAATSLALALLIGGRVFAMMKRSLGVSQWVRRGLGALVLAAVVAIGLGLDTGLLTQVSLASTGSLEQGLLDQLGRDDPNKPQSSLQASSDGTLPIEGQLPSLDGAVQWFNSPPLTADDLKGKVILVDFWTYSCINCLRSIPYVQAWAEKYRDQGLVVIGVHSPEFAFEKDMGNVAKAIRDLKITYPVAADNDFTIWRAFNNQYWPAHFFIDAKGDIRYHHYGEGDYDHSEKVIQQLLAEAGQTNLPDTLVSVDATGAQAAASNADVRSPETYVGYARAEKFAAPGGLRQDAVNNYGDAPTLALNQWTLTGTWLAGREYAVPILSGSAISYRFHARDLHLVLGTGADRKPVRFRVTVDGKAPGDDHGTDIDADGYGAVDEQRLYQLVRQQGPIVDRTFEIEFLDPGAEAFAFTFG